MLRFIPFKPDLGNASGGKNAFSYNHINNNYFK